MSKATRWALVYLWLAFACALAGSGTIAACATGGASGGDDDAGVPIDAAVNVRLDSSTVSIDAPSPMPDASVPMPDAMLPPPDAPPGSLFCSTNADCTTAGQCCFTLGGPMGFCAPGTVILGACIPIN